MKKSAALIFILIVVITIVSQVNMHSQKKISVGDKVPDFSLKDQFGVDFRTADHVGQKAMVIYFYPKDDTPGCTKEACSFRDSYTEFSDRNVIVIGISSDSVDSHKNFSEKYNLPFTLLADTKKEVRKLFGVPSNMLGLIPGRVTYIVDKKGIVIYIYNSMTNAEGHMEEALKALK